MRFVHIVWLLAGLAVNQAQAFGNFGHRVVADIAQAGLSKRAAAEVATLLKVAPRATLAELSTWPDELREEEASASHAGSSTARWHYMNFQPGLCAALIASACPTGDCLVPRLEQQIALLGDSAQPLAARARALGFVVHLFGDLHQPLHLGYGRDKGGNDFQISIEGRVTLPAQTRFPAARAGLNLHALWDSLIFDLPGVGEKAEAAAIRALRPGARAARLIDVVAIARESCALVQAPGFYPSSHKLSRRYLESIRSSAQLRVALAGARLARLLNMVLADAPTGLLSK
jgi:nuclease S1